MAPSKRKTPLVLTRKEDIKLLQLCLQHFKPDGGPRTTMPWSVITKEFNKWLTRGEVTSLSRHVSKLIKDREMELRNSVIKDENEKDPYDDAIDKWIIVHRGAENQIWNRRKPAEEPQVKNRRALRKHDDLTKTCCQKRKRRQEDLTSSDDDQMNRPTSASLVSPLPISRSPRYQSLGSQSPGRQSPAYRPLQVGSTRHEAKQRNRSTHADIPKVTHAKKARTEVTAMNTAITELTAVVKSAFDTRGNSKDLETLEARIAKLEQEVALAKKDRELQNVMLAKILEAIQEKVHSEGVHL